MLNKAYRLPLTRRIQPIRSYKTPFFVVKVFPSDTQNPRFGFIVSKSTAKNAVTRNRVKRQVRAGIEELLPRINQGYDILFIVHKGSLSARSSEIRAQIKKVLSSLNVLS